MFKKSYGRIYVLAYVKSAFEMQLLMYIVLSTVNLFPPVLNRYTCTFSMEVGLFPNKMHLVAYANVS